MQLHWVLYSVKGTPRATCNFLANIFVRTVLTDLPDTPCQYCIKFQHCHEQQFQKLSCVHYTIFSVVTLDLLTRARYWIAFLLWKNYAYASRISCLLLYIVHVHVIQLISKIVLQQYDRTRENTLCKAGSLSFK